MIAFSAFENAAVYEMRKAMDQLKAGFSRCQNINCTNRRMNCAKPCMNWFNVQWRFSKFVLVYWFISLLVYLSISLLVNGTLEQ
jgi:hypothetical protein